MNFDNCKIISDHIIVKPIKNVDKELNGIYIPETANEFHLTGCTRLGTVIKAGPGRKNKKGIFISNEIKDGYTVMYVNGSGSVIPSENGNLLGLREFEILAIIEE